MDEGTYPLQKPLCSVYKIDPHSPSEANGFFLLSLWQYSDHMSEEYVVLVDEGNNVIGKALKSEVHTANTPLHRAFSVYIFNKKGELLLQQRSSKKKTWPLVWSNSCCGHPGPGEATEAAVYRRVKHELGIELGEIYNILPDFTYRAELDGIVEHEICPVFMAVVDSEPKTNPDEVEAIRWVPWQVFVEEALAENAIYSPWCILEVQELVRNKKFNNLLETLTAQ